VKRIKRMLAIGLIAFLMVIGLGSVTHSQTTLPITIDPSKADSLYPFAEAAKAKQLINSFKQGSENRDPKNPDRLKNDLRIDFGHSGIFQGGESVKVKVIEDDGTVLAEQVVLKKDILIQWAVNPKTGAPMYGLAPWFFELPKGKRILKGATIELPDLEYTQHFDRVDEANLYRRTRT
jgi:hypothetical protein